MKKLSHLLLMFAAAIFVFASCEGPEGPAGPAGAQGDQGIQGIQGLPGDVGPSGTTTCVDCHDASATIATKQAQWENSLHATGENAAYGNRLFGTVYPAGDCAKCHVSQGFHEFMGTGTVAGAPFDEPQQINCYTCHDIHATHTEADWDLTYEAAITMNQGGMTYDNGASNLCAFCHQARAVSPNPDATAGSTVITISSNRFGTHHGPVANVIAGVAESGLYEVAGTVAYSNSMHATSISGGCVSCHMAPGYSDMSGGHTMNLIGEVHHEESLNDAGCTSCHTSGYTLTELETYQATIQVKLDALLALLSDPLIDIYDPANGRNKTGDFTNDVAGAYLNWQTLTEDRSLGVHNPKYVGALLDNSIEAMDAIANPAK